MARLSAPISTWPRHGCRVGASFSWVAVGEPHFPWVNPWETRLLHRNPWERTSTLQLQCGSPFPWVAVGSFVSYGLLCESPFPWVAVWKPRSHGLHREPRARELRPHLQIHKGILHLSFTIRVSGTKPTSVISPLYLTINTIPQTPGGIEFCRLSDEGRLWDCLSDIT